MKNRYKYLKVIQQDYGYGWEDVSEYETNSIGQPVDRVIVKYPNTNATYSTTLLNCDLKEYRLMGYSTRVIKRRILI